MVNYIIHLGNALARFVESPEQSNTQHRMLYMALFNCWNSAFFRNPISINRQEMMLYAGIGSTNTYHKCLTDLHTWGYIRYEPSRNRMLGSKVFMVRFDKDDKRGKKKARRKSDTARASTRAPAKYKKKTTGKQSTVNTSSTLPQPVRRSINSKNNTNLKNNKNAYEQANANSNLSVGKSRNTGSNKGGRKTRKRGKTEDCHRPGTIREAIAYFEEKKSTAAEAEKFHNYFQSVGWRVGGRSAMKDWHAAARNWIANIPNYNNTKHDKNKVFKPQLTGKKNYAEPF